MNKFVHFRYHDSIDALAGIHRWRYERVRFDQIEDMVRSLVRQGMDQFAWRELEAYEPWMPVSVFYEPPNTTMVEVSFVKHLL